MEKVGLVLQGGGSRGIYTAGVLDYFMEKELYIPYVIAVSAGACNGAAYLARQRGLGKIYHMKYIRDPRYFHYKNLIKKRSLFGMDFIFNEMPNKLEPFAFDRFRDAKEKFVVVTTDCTTGEAVYFTKDDCEDIFHVIRASCSLPFLSPKVTINGRKLWDGGIVHPVPFMKSMLDGNQKHIIVLTSSCPPSEWMRKLSRVERFFSRSTRLCQAFIRHFRIYYETIEQVKEMQKEGKAFVIAPPADTFLRGFERQEEKLEHYYRQGYQDARTQFSGLCTWLSLGRNS
ncbi:patatin family protein [Brevibacillus formosus]|uniref:patatin-like phospholipase family protein n=1 Tax=Brevibacillus formosus TaxID=54913 RepID=UPI001C66B121|nr:patatin family protein [Brevibacillus formosus]MBW5466383.1 patatin family protein [Brevibacillus formosus]